MRAGPLISLLIALTPPAPAQVQPRYIDSREVVLAFGGGDTVERVETWLTLDDGQSWSPAEVARINDGSVAFTAPRDGRFGFFLVLENAAGRSAEPPGPGSAPHITVVVDTAPPTLQIRRATARSDAPASAIELRLTLIEENLAAGGLRLFYRDRSSDPWTDGGPLDLHARSANAADASVSWTPPTGTTARLDLLLVGTDRAGNTARDETAGVLTRRANPPPHAPTTQPGIETATSVAAANSRETDAQRAADLARAEQMRALAARFLAEGRLDLAAARFSDAVAASPNDPQLLTEYGAALVRSNRLDDARQRFETALQAAPKNTAALEGLALVAMGQQRLPDARDTLKRVLEIDSGAGRVWLRYGDVEYRMGNHSAALDAWKKAADSSGDAQLRATVNERLKTLQR